MRERVILVWLTLSAVLRYEWVRLAGWLVLAMLV